MRHGKKFNHLGRKTAHRKAMLANMACSLIERKRITTTVAKAKALRVYVEPLLTKSKDDSTHSRRVVFSYLKSKTAVSELFRDVAPKIGERNGGYTRILKTGNRLGDNADMCFIELVDFNDTYISDKKEQKAGKRTRRGAAKTQGVKAAPAAAETKGVEDVTFEEVVEDKVEAIVEEVAEKEVETPKEEVIEEAPKAEEKKEEVKAEATDKVEDSSEEKGAEEKDQKEDDTKEDKKQD